LERDAAKNYKADFARLEDELEDMEKVIEGVHDTASDSTVKYFANVIAMLLTVVDEYFINLDWLINGDEDRCTQSSSFAIGFAATPKWSPMARAT